MKRKTTGTSGAETSFSVDPSFDLTRRRLLRQSSMVAASCMLGRSARDGASHHGKTSNAAQHPSVEAFDPSLVFALASQALDAARSAGARYADVRLTRTVNQSLYTQWSAKANYTVRDDEALGLGVRALVGGYWGFAATPYWTPAEAVRVAQSAVAQANVNAAGPARPVELGTYPVVKGDWVMPIKQDPFLVSLEEKIANFDAIGRTASRMLPRVSRTGGPVRFDDFVGGNFLRQERVVATTEGTYVSQTVYRSAGTFGVSVYDSMGNRVGQASPTGLELSGRGWELFADTRLLDQMPELLAKAESFVSLPFKPVDVGRYDLVCDARTMARLLDVTFGTATELDRALGYEANASGTSYLGPDPLAWLGTSVASPLVNITANRSLVGGLATVRWDDEGVVPNDFPLVTRGALVDYQTTREQAAWLGPWYAKQGQPARSHGCASAEDALSITMQMAPNLSLAPSASMETFDTLVASMAKGVAALACDAQADFQAKNGSIVAGDSGFYEIKDGKIVARLVNAGVLFNTIELWKNVTALGGTGSVAPLPGWRVKGEPSQLTMHTVSAVPAALKDLAIVDTMRKA